ncbi:non-ribosomal peptide synthetase [Vibrio sp. MEBiC08052]|uniref:non-ribosomal peptide synthetase n=1 Tax=Vibrio sp. MEBiC08052 TaxID=1761910 RepID=UPI000740772D|nr:non-ribosomal peptide synthetase [Vibrio sp. MEBiC08052]KUI97645.1 amino acid adenylation domain-containing protein [Vibrio sp. MEBiC08052]
MSSKYLLKALEIQTKNHPKKTAVTDEHESLSFEEFYSRICELSEKIKQQSNEGATVAVSMKRSVNFVVAAYAVWMANRVYVPMDHNWPESRKYKVQQLADAELLIGFDSIEVLQPEKTGTTKSDHAYIIFTSGTTGIPKGVLVSHRAYEHLVRKHQTDIYQPSLVIDGNVAMNASFCFDSSLERLALVALGYSLHIISDDVRKSPQLLVNYIRENDICNIDLVPSHLKLLLDVGLGSLAVLRLLIVGGEAINRDLWCSLVSLNITAYNVYGPTENTINTSIAKIEGDIPTIGKLFDGVDGIIVNESGEVCGVGEAGELYVSGAHLAEGYYNDHLRTEQSFVMFNGKRCYRTGDLVKQSHEGNLLFLGRIDEQVKISGYRIEVEEIRRAILSLTGISDAAVSVVLRENNSPSLLASVVLYDGQEVSIDKLKCELEKSLPSYMIPTLWQTIKSVPLTDNLKSDHKSLLNQWKIQATRSDQVIPSGNLDNMFERVKKVWVDVLEQPDLSLDTHFFTVGDSLSAMSLMVLLEKELNCQVSLPELFKYPTIRSLSTYLESRTEEAI